MRKKVLFTFGFKKEDKEFIESLGYEIYEENEKDLYFKDYMEEVEALVCYNPFTTLDIRKMKKLKWIQLSSIGVDQLAQFKSYIEENNIVVSNNKGGYSIAIGEWIVLNILEIYKKRKEVYKNKENRKWKLIYNMPEIYGKTIGFIGTGSLALEAAKRLQGFGATIVGLNTDGTNREYFNYCYKNDDIEKMMPICDVVVVTIPYTKETYKFIDERKLALMKKDSILINVARGEVIDEYALYKYLKEKKIKAAALDVFDKEPLPVDNKLWELDNVIITAHNSWLTKETFDRRWNFYKGNLIRYINEEKVENIVDFNKGY